VTEKFPACCLRPEIHRFGVAKVSIVSNNPTPVRLEEPRRAVRRVIVDDDDFVGTGRVSADSFEKELIMTELIMNGDNDAQHNFNAPEESIDQIFEIPPAPQGSI